MGDFTRQEKVIITFLSFVLIVGLGIDFYKKNFSRPQLKLKAYPVGQLRQSARTSKLINVNQADVDQLSKLPGVGPRLAKRIIKYREAHGRFNRKEDLLKVRGIGTKKLAEIEDFLSF